MAITIKNEGVSISAARDGAMFNTFSGNMDYVIKDIGNELAITYDATSLDVNLGTGEAVICGRSTLVDAQKTLTLSADTTGYLVLHVDLNQTGENVCTFAAVTTISGGNINNGVDKVRDFVLGQYTTDASGVSSFVDKRVITNSSIVSSGQTGPCIIVKATTGSTVSVSDGTTTFSGVTDSDNKKEFYLNKRGNWTASYNGDNRLVKVTENKDYTVDYTNTIMGVMRDITGSSPACTRTDDAVGKNATASIGTSAGSSDFDTMAIYKDITRVNIGDDVMVRIPKFYYRRYREGNIEYEKIASNPTENFAVHPAFLRNGIEYPYIYVGAYKTSANTKSTSGVAPQVSKTRASFRADAVGKGLGWSLIDFAARMAVNTLMKIEFATLDMQTAIGAGCSSLSAATNTGTCDGVPNLTGRPAGTSDKVDVVWRGIEGWWGNVWEWTDGLNFNGGTYYICNNPASYADDTAAGYTALSYTGATSWSESYIKTMGYDENNSYAQMPNAVGGTSSTYYCDVIWSSTGWKVLRCGGNWGDGTACGPWASVVNSASSVSFAYVGSRLLYLASE